MVKSVVFAELLLHLSPCVGPEAVVLPAGDGGQLHLGPPLVLLDRDRAVEISPVLEDMILLLQLPDLVEQRVSPPGQHEVKVQVDLPSLHVRILDFIDHQVEGGVGTEVGDREHDAAVLHVVAGADVFQWQLHIQLRQGESLNMADKRFFQLFLWNYQTFDSIICP